MLEKIIIDSEKVNIIGKDIPLGSYFLRPKSHGDVGIEVNYVKRKKNTVINMAGTVVILNLDKKMMDGTIKFINADITYSGSDCFNLIYSLQNLKIQNDTFDEEGIACFTQDNWDIRLHRRQDMETMAKSNQFLCHCKSVDFSINNMFFRALVSYGKGTDFKDMEYGIVDESHYNAVTIKPEMCPENFVCLKEGLCKIISISKDETARIICLPKAYDVRTVYIPWVAVEGSCNSGKFRIKNCVEEVENYSVNNFKVRPIITDDAIANKRVDELKRLTERVEYYLSVPSHDNLINSTKVKIDEPIKMGAIDLLFQTPLFYAFRNEEIDFKYIEGNFFAYYTAKELRTEEIALCAWRPKTGEDTEFLDHTLYDYMFENHCFYRWISIYDSLYGYKELRSPFDTDYIKFKYLFDQKVVKFQGRISGSIPSRWRSEKYIYLVSKVLYPDSLYQYRCSWLGNQILDIYIPSISVAIECQGEQHYYAKTLEGVHIDNNKQIENDELKRKKCYENGVSLYEYDMAMQKVLLPGILSFFKRIGLKSCSISEFGEMVNNLPTITVREYVKMLRP
jgi:hypothetical protein